LPSIKPEAGARENRAPVLFGEWGYHEPDAVQAEEAP
jgi:hypothetical protein